MTLGNYVYVIIIFYIIKYEVSGFIICMHPSYMQTLVEAAKNVLAVHSTYLELSLIVDTHSFDIVLSLFVDPLRV